MGLKLLKILAISDAASGACAENLLRYMVFIMLSSCSLTLERVVAL